MNAMGALQCCGRCPLRWLVFFVEKQAEPACRFAGLRGQVISQARLQSRMAAQNRSRFAIRASFSC